MVLANVSFFFSLFIQPSTFTEAKKRNRDLESSDVQSLIGRGNANTFDYDWKNGFIQFLVRATLTFQAHLKCENLLYKKAEVLA